MALFLCSVVDQFGPSMVVVFLRFYDYFFKSEWSGQVLSGCRYAPSGLCKYDNLVQ
jgi:hypothetical protein